MRTLIALAACLAAALACRAEEATQFTVQKKLKQVLYTATVTEVARKAEKGRLTRLVLKAMVTRGKRQWNVTYVYGPARERFIIEKDDTETAITYEFATCARTVKGPDYRISEHDWHIRVFLRDRGAWRETNSPSALVIARMRMQDSNDWTEVLTALLFPAQEDPLHRAPNPLQGFVGKQIEGGEKAK